jgi:preprotein translocase subunit SecD
MVNWREDIEYVYVLSIFVSAIVVFFYIYDTMGLMTAILATAGLASIEALIGFVAFETDRAIATWERIEKEPPSQEKNNDANKIK